MFELLRQLRVDRSKGSERKPERGRAPMLGQREFGHAMGEAQVKRPAELQKPILPEELGASPGPAIQAIYERLLALS